MFKSRFDEVNASDGSALAAAGSAVGNVLGPHEAAAAGRRCVSKTGNCTYAGSDRIAALSIHVAHHEGHSTYLS